MIFLLCPFSFVVSLCFVPISKRLAERAHAIDLPDFKRKFNTSPVARLGGLAFFSAFFTSLTLKSLLQGSPLDAAEATLLSAGGLAALLGALDDLFCLKPWVKLLCQSLISAFSLLLLFGDSLSPAGFLVRTLYLIFVMNVFNVADGLDGLCGGISLSSLIFLGAFGLLFFNTGAAFSAILLFFSLLGFIPCNAYPANLYMGDTGSHFLGLAIGVLSLLVLGENFLLSALLFIIPAADLLVSIPRRLFDGRSPFSADRGHLHYTLVDIGLSHSAAVNIILVSTVLISLTVFLPRI